MPTPAILEREKTGLLVIDLQGKPFLVQNHQAVGSNRDPICLEQGRCWMTHSDGHLQAILIYPPCRRHPPIRCNLVGWEPINRRP